MKWETYCERMDSAHIPGGRRRMIIDTDAGVDDAEAILFTTSQPDIDVIGVTCVGGNTSLANVILNVQRCLAVRGLSKMPLFSGASVGLVQPAHEATYYHGKDGLGDASHDGEDIALRPVVQPEHAASALIRLCREGLRIVSQDTSKFGLRREITRWSLEIAHRQEQLAETIAKGNLAYGVKIQHTIAKLKRFVAHATKICQEMLGERFETQDTDVEPTVEILALGPLTNLALAARMTAEFPLMVRTLMIMGGTEKRANILGHYGAEFNFYNDPEAVHITLDSFPLAMMATFEFTLQHAVTWDAESKWSASGTEVALFREKITRRSVKRCQEFKNQGYCSCDLIAAIALVRPTETVQEVDAVGMAIELHGEARSSCLIDWAHLVPSSPNVFLLTKMSIPAYCELVERAFGYAGCQRCV